VFLSKLPVHTDRFNYFSLISLAQTLVAVALGLQKAPKLLKLTGLSPSFWWMTIRSNRPLEPS